MLKEQVYEWLDAHSGYVPSDDADLVVLMQEEIDIEPDMAFVFIDQWRAAQAAGADNVPPVFLLPEEQGSEDEPDDPDKWWESGDYDQDWHDDSE